MAPLAPLIASGLEPPAATAVISPVDTDQAIRACFPVLRQLRPHLVDAEQLVAQIRRMRQQNYRLLAVSQGGDPSDIKGVAGYRFQESLIYGRFVYVDDLVVADDQRSAGLGATLLDAVAVEARAAGCMRFVLDTGLGNALAQRFYFRWGLLAGGMHFSCPLA